MSLAQTPDELRSLLALTKHIAKLEAAAVRDTPKRTAKRGTITKNAWPPCREAMLAATTLQLQPGDILVAEPEDSVVSALAPKPVHGERKPLFPDLNKDNSRLMLSAAMAAAARVIGTDRLALAYVREGALERGWAAALTWAQTHQLPLVLVCADSRGNGAFREAGRSPEETFTWGKVDVLARKLQIPVLSADGEDAVAMYRVAEESILRARAGRGPTVLWAMLPSADDLAEARPGRPKVAAPVARLQRYLRSRNVPLR